MSLISAVSISAAAMSVLTACGGEVISGGEVTVLVSEPADGGMDALGGGRLEVVGGCLGASGVVMIWPHGTKVVTEEPLTIDIPSHGTFALGDDVQVVGGLVLEHSFADVEPGTYRAGGVDVPAECAKHDIWVANLSVS